MVQPLHARLQHRLDHVTGRRQRLLRRGRGGALRGLLCACGWSSPASSETCPAQAKATRLARFKAPACSARTRSQLAMYHAPAHRLGAMLPGPWKFALDMHHSINMQHFRAAYSC